jgi:protein TonB
MRPDPRLAAELFTPREVAAAAGVAPARVRALIRAGRIIPAAHGLLEFPQAVAAVRLLRGATGNQTAAPTERPCLLLPSSRARLGSGPFLASATLHGFAATLLLLTTTTGLTGAEVAAAIERSPVPVRLVYLVQPGPGGGGGGGGRRQAAPAPPAERRGTHLLSSPVMRRREPPPVPPPQIDPPRLLPHEPLPPLVAPVAAAPADRRDRVGTVEETTATMDSRGPGSGDGVGQGAGSGMGEGRGPGIGPGWGGGTGGGPYRPGSGIEPPRVLTEVRPDYSEEARRRHIEGEVVLEVEVQRDGRVGAVRVLRGLGYGLDERAVEAVRQWRFAPAHRLGTPVDVLVEVEVEFRLR